MYHSHSHAVTPITVRSLRGDRMGQNKGGCSEDFSNSGGFEGDARAVAERHGLTAGKIN